LRERKSKGKFYTKQTVAGFESFERMLREVITDSVVVAKQETLLPHSREIARALALPISRALCSILGGKQHVTFKSPTNILFFI